MLVEQYDSGEIVSDATRGNAELVRGDLRLVSRLEYDSGAVALRYEPRS